MSLPEPSQSSRKSSSGSDSCARPAAAFNYDKDVFVQFQRYIVEKNAHGLALLARQKGVPPFLRFKVWPILLKHHPFVVNPFIQPDSIEKERASPESESDDQDLQLLRRIRKDLRRYMHGIAYSSAEEPFSQTELRVFDILERAVFKFVTKWGKIIKYDQALTWIALGLAEWFPPIPNTLWVLLGREVSSSSHTCIGSVFDDYEAYIDSVADLRDFLNEMVEDGHISSMKFHEVFERLALVLLHSPEMANKRENTGKVKINKSTLPTNGGTIEERVSFFIYVFQRLLPELSLYFQEELILNKFGLHDDEWLIWWLKYCGSKVWSRVDRGRVWDLLIGWRLQKRKSEGSASYYSEKLNLEGDLLDKLGPDAFWSLDYEEVLPSLVKDDSFNDLINDLHINNSPPSSAENLVTLPSSLATSSSCDDVFNRVIPFSKIDPHIELLFVSIAVLKAKENTLVELDQHEIRTFLSRLPAKSYSLSDKYKQYQEQKDKAKGAAATEYVFTYDYMDSIIYEAGELWRKWLWFEMNGEN